MSLASDRNTAGNQHARVCRVGIIVGYFAIVSACAQQTSRSESAPPRDLGSLTAVATPHGRYSLENLNPVALTMDGKTLPSCGVEARVLLAGFRPVEIVFDAGRVQVNGHEWPVTYINRGQAYGAGWAAAFGSITDYVIVSSPDSLNMQLSFQRWDNAAHGELLYMNTRDGQPICVDARDLAGRYTRH